MSPMTKLGDPLVLAGEVLALMLPPPQQQLLLDLGFSSYCGRGAVHHCSRSSVYLFCRGHHTAIFIISMFMLLLLKDLLAKFIITCTLKDKLTTWLCLVEGYLASL
jgi:hypothetical protein